MILKHVTLMRKCVPSLRVLREHSLISQKTHMHMHPTSIWGQGLGPLLYLSQCPQEVNAWVMWKLTQTHRHIWYSIQDVYRCKDEREVCSTCVHSRTDTHLHTCHLYTYRTCIHACMHTSIHTYTHRLVHTHINTDMLERMHPYTHIHTCIRTYIHTYMDRQADRNKDRQTSIHTYMSRMNLLEAACMIWKQDVTIWPKANRRDEDNFIIRGERHLLLLTHMKWARSNEDTQHAKGCSCSQDGGLCHPAKRRAMSHLGGWKVPRSRLSALCIVMTIFST